MKTMMFTDLITMKNSLLVLIGLDVVLGLLLTFAMQTLMGGLAAMMVIVPFMYLFSISAYDEMGGWERFRLTLPITRRQVAWGRYASLAVVLAGSMVLTFVVGHVVVSIGDALPDAPTYITSAGTGFYQVACVVAMGAAIVMLTATISLPLILRFGMTKATRILPVAIVIILAVGIAFFGEASIDQVFWQLSGNMLDWGVDMMKLGIAVAIVALIALYLASAFIAAKFYAKREF